MTLHHTGHEATTSHHAEARILQHGGTSAECEVGYSVRSGKPGAYSYAIHNLSDEVVYRGPSMGDGMTALEATLPAGA